MAKNNGGNVITTFQKNRTQKIFTNKKGVLRAEIKFNSFEMSERRYSLPETHAILSTPFKFQIYSRSVKREADSIYGCEA